MVSPGGPPAPEPKTPFRWGLAIAIFAAGAIVTATGFILFGRDDPDAYWASAIVKLGTTMLLAAGLVVGRTGSREKRASHHKTGRYKRRR